MLGGAGWRELESRLSYMTSCYNEGNLIWIQWHFRDTSGCRQKHQNLAFSSYTEEKTRVNPDTSILCNGLDYPLDNPQKVNFTERLSVRQPTEQGNNRMVQRGEHD